MAIFTTIVSFTAVIMNDMGVIRTDPGVLGLTISLLLQLSMLFQYMIRQSAQVVNNMVSVERVLQFRDLPSEAAFTNEYDNQVSAQWPNNGTINIQDLSVRYREGLPLSLQNLSLHIDGGSRVGKFFKEISVACNVQMICFFFLLNSVWCELSISLGIVGRTGCGKSTLLSSLLRLLEAESGQIVIDGIVSTVSFVLCCTMNTHFHLFQYLKELLTLTHNIMTSSPRTSPKLACVS